MSRAIPPVGSTDVLLRHIPCIQCKYDLYGLHPESRCPECGAPIGGSVAKYNAGIARQRDDVPLSKTDPAWLRQMGEAAILLMIAQLWPAVGMPISGCFEPRQGRNLGYTWERVWYLAPYCLSWALAFWAVWKLGRAEPATVERPNENNSGILMRILAVIWLAAPMLINPGNTDHAIRECYWLMLTAAPISAIFYFRLGAIARRGGRAALSGECFVLGAVTCGLVVLAMLAMPAEGGYPIWHHRSRWWADEVFMVSPLPGAWPWTAVEFGSHIWWEWQRVSDGVFVVFALAVPPILWQSVVLVRIAKLTHGAARRQTAT